MVQWDFLLDEAALASVLPGEYARFALPVREGLTVFLEGLPTARQEAILEEQAALPMTATISDRLGTLARSCPVLHKLGQILARDSRLAPELRHRLKELESLPPAVPRQAIQETLTRELGPLDRLGITLASQALAEASVAVVIPFQYRSTGGAVQEGVFKVLKQGIEDRLSQELALLEQVGAHLDQRCEAMGLPQLDYQESFQQVRDKLQGEVRLDQEQQHLEQAWAVYRNNPRVQIPTLFDFCTPRLTAMERVSGGKVTDSCVLASAESGEAASLVVEALIAQPIFSRVGQALFHSDPHAGNLFLTTDRRLAILDWSLVGRLDERQRTAMVQLLVAAIRLRPAQIAAILEQLAERRPLDRPALERVVHAWLKRIRQGEPPGLSWLMGLLDEAVQTARLRVGADLMLFRKSLHTLEGVVGDLGAGPRRIDEILWREFLSHLVAEWPRRWWTPPDSRAFATRLSNADLLHTMLDAPCTAARFWIGHGFDLWGNCLAAASTTR